VRLEKSGDREGGKEENGIRDKRGVEEKRVFVGEERRRK
jgi:hypothetical protein